ncbi:hypothetical protein HanPSC8_Chr08g0325801 [Helianthus annuus]|nr:hypothetical protein HanPSC8_Chr08g0325801 [Helianthus annuus]
MRCTMTSEEVMIRRYLRSRFCTRMKMMNHIRIEDYCIHELVEIEPVDELKK